MTTEIQITQHDIDTLNKALNVGVALSQWEGAVLHHWTSMHQIAYDAAARHVQAQTASFDADLKAGQSLVAQWEQELALAAQLDAPVQGHDYQN